MNDEDWINMLYFFGGLLLGFFSWLYYCCISNIKKQINEANKKFTTTTCADTGEFVYTYQEYLQSKHWANLKERYKKGKLNKDVRFAKLMSI